MAVNWYANTTCKIHFDMHTPEDVEHVGRDFDPAAFAAAIKSAGAEAVCFFARCAYGWAYYPTEVGLPHPNLARDLFGEGVAALKEQGIRAIAYCAIDNAPTALVEQHPSWAKRSPDGEPVPGHGTATSCCAFGPFPRELLIPQFCEIADRYPVDGFFLDGVYQCFNKVCYCEHCGAGFGRDIPQEPDDPNWRAYRHWQVTSVWETMGRAADEVARVRPGCQFGVNWLAAIRWSVPPPASVGYLTGDPPMQNCTFDTAFNLAAWAWRDQPADLMTQRMLHNWQDFTCRTPETIQTEFATGLAAGGRLFIGDLLRPVDVKPDDEVMRLMRGCFAFASERGPLAMGAKRRADVAILSSPETIRTRGATWPVDDAPLRGAYHALSSAGLTVDILYDADLEQHLPRYQTLVVPEQAFVSRQAGRVIEQFVDGGGGMVVLGGLPKCVDPEEPDSAADAAVFDQITGLADEGRHPFDLGYLRLRGTPAEGFWREGDDFRPAIPIHGAPAKVRADGAEVLVRLTAPGQTYQIGARPAGETLDAPALTRRALGQGAVMFCALPVASDVWKRGNPGAKYVLEHLVRAVTPAPSVERVAGPASVQVFWAERGNQTIVHLVAYQPDGRTAMPHVVESPCEVAGVQVRVRDPRRYRTVRVEPDGPEPRVSQDSDALLVNVGPFDTHAAVVIEWG